MPEETVPTKEVHEEMIKPFEAKRNGPSKTEKRPEEKKKS